MTSSLDPPAGLVREVVALALREDLGLLGDLTSIAVIPEDAEGTARFVARGDGADGNLVSCREIARRLELEAADVDGTGG